MGKLTSKKRNSLPASNFGEPGKRAYHMPDRSHAANAKARASEAVHKGRMSPGTEAKIDAKADRILDKGRTTTQRRADAHRGHDRKHGRALTNRILPN